VYNALRYRFVPESFVFSASCLRAKVHLFPGRSFCDVQLLIGQA
jgi:hypothetical protein